MKPISKKIIIAPLNWGLGHVTRCVPLINALLENGFQPIIASDGQALKFLKQEFPNLESLELPSYQISYGKNLKLKLLLKFPRIYKVVQQEKKRIQNFIDKNNDVVGIISDNRFGVFSNKVPSIYLTHQIKVFSGFSTFITSYFHQKIIRNFDECWVPDNIRSEFSGRLTSINKYKNVRFIGVLSRFQKEYFKKEIDILVLLSGPEPNRTLLESRLISEFRNDTRTIVFVLGKVEDEQKKWVSENITFYNYLLSNQLEKILNLSKIIVCRSGYSSIMDLAVLEKKVFFIPTKNQPEQEYLAKHLENKKIAPFSTLKGFSKEKLLEVDNYDGLKSEETKLSKDLFSLFKRKRKL